MALDPILERIAELWYEQKHRDLTEKEMSDMGECLEWIMNYVWKKRRLENLSLLASMTDDVEWLHEISRRIDELQTGVTIIRKRKKPGPKGTD